VGDPDDLLVLTSSPSAGPAFQGVFHAMISHSMRLLLISVVGLSFEMRVEADDERGFKKLFDGTTLKGWRGDESFWRVEDEAIVAESTAKQPCRKNQFLIWDAGEVDDFELRLQFRMTGSPSANSGIQFRGTENDDGHVIGYQADIDRAGQWVGALYDEHTARRGQARPEDRHRSRWKTENFRVCLLRRVIQARPAGGGVE
jgi:hypothetical protein